MHFMTCSSPSTKNKFTRIHLPLASIASTLTIARIATKLSVKQFYVIRTRVQITVTSFKHGKKTFLTIIVLRRLLPDRSASSQVMERCHCAFIQEKKRRKKNNFVAFEKCTMRRNRESKESGCFQVSVGLQPGQLSAAGWQIQWNFISFYKYQDQMVFITTWWLLSGAPD